MPQDMLGKTAYVYLRKSRMEEGLETYGNSIKTAPGGNTGGAPKRKERLK